MSSLKEPLVSHGCGVGTRSGSAGGVQCEHFALDMDESKKVAAHSAQVRPGDGNRCVGRNRRVDSVSASCEHLVAGRRCDVVGTGDEVSRRTN